MDVLSSLAAGVVAGFGVAAPLGAIGILLLREGLTAGFRAAAPAAFAVALVDTVYCTLAVFAGAAAAPLAASWGSLPAVAGGTALILLGLAGIRQTCRGVPRPAAAAGAPAPAPAETEANRRAVRAAKHRGRFALFVALTAVNPVTLLYFAALAAGLRDLLAPPAGPAAFITGVAAASLSWQLGLVFSGAFLRGRASPAVQRGLSLAGHSAVAVLGAAAVVIPLL
ncbi:LysE family transporter [Arthrobacter sp. Helios]|uniref:LysE family transporter n=1 Tax=Arthrobacter sp. Helios TaxID=2828862 RepID=UPI002052177D|nr:LysE family transporter [Arthrobacter sp. Helios]UPO76586.1 LysE family transporter [Arthrobacter sp. Helios]